MKAIRLTSVVTVLLSWLLPTTVNGIESPATAAAAAIFTDHSKDAVSLFNNMRTPAALLTGGLVPLGVLSAPPIDDGKDTKLTKFLKEANMILGVASLLSEIIAVIYSSIAINKLVELPSPVTAGVAELIQQNHELAWLGTNIHFLFGMMGFTLLVGNRVYLTFGHKLGKLAIGLSLSCFLQALSVVNRGIAMGSINDQKIQTQFASNFFFLCCRYVSVAVKHAIGSGLCGTLAVVIAVLTVINTAYSFIASAMAPCAISASSPDGKEKKPKEKRR